VGVIVGGAASLGASTGFLSIVGVDGVSSLFFFDPSSH